MIIDCIGCLHGFLPDLNGGDLLIITGDITARDTFKEFEEFNRWIGDQKYRLKIVIGGNHDNLFTNENTPWRNWAHFHYLCDSGTEFEGLKIWGSPWTKTFPGMNPKCKAFTVDTEKELQEKWALIPDDTDILISHCPPLRIRDRTVDGIDAGSISLRSKSYNSNIKLHVFSHIHESYGQVTAYVRTSPKKKIKTCIYLNCSIMNERYHPVNAPIRIEL